MYKNFIKRFLDIVISFTALVILSPLFLILTILGFFILGGNPFFVQERPGKDEKIFKLIKFRSMNNKKDKDGNLLPDGDRYSKYGLILRKTSLDEIPELINILKGDMSLIGPRPLLVAYLPLYTEQEHLRHSVRPGLTGLAQANGRNFMTWEEVFAYDLEYIQNITFLNDLKILIDTVLILFKKGEVEDRSKVTKVDDKYIYDDGKTKRAVHEALDIERKDKKIISREIGSDFTDIPVIEKENHIFDDVSWFISGRAALDYVLKDIKAKHEVKTIAVPSWCCDTMLAPIQGNNLDIIFYSVAYEKNQLVIENDIKADILLKLDYFGYDIKNNFKFNGIVISDMTHSIFVKQKLEEDYSIGSLRKWAGFKTGGFAYCKDGFVIDKVTKENKEYFNLRKKAMFLKKKYLGYYSISKEYLNVFSKAESLLEDAYGYVGDKEDAEAAKHLDIEFIQKKRQENANYLINHLTDYSIFKEVKKEDCPLFVPIIVPNGKRDELRKYLISKKIYCPIHWPLTNFHKISEKDKIIYENELSLICDQRYTLNDMEYIVNCIQEKLG